MIKKKKSEEKNDLSKPKIRIKLRSFDHRVLDVALKNILEVIYSSGAKVIGPVYLPVERKMYTVLRSTFVHKDAREQFEKRIYKRLIDIIDFTPETLEALRTLHLPAGVDIEIKM
ncbi:30S ribosomal protein S10 [bacterium (Candidatus Moisslbacteria) CG12_big_fil_rev_8_21_14_0_65_36_11]|nr:30S ribosomal protein S10 [Candidatus Kuenenbacteria bacterium]OIP76375.1 MAG: 30S ribosomal protein S10 [Parcubacteria group bacterium CG2_30_36_38]PIV45986.1 MAG: 30S ribosomal protein S10 [bacterium (Candidatus Moisslbacteria) CG02_land_8_20_14_3_00_36_53]PIW68124.1 MAG: 30S ribosomal protein S10 [bacterium (Candidatus Moisslbacteria) CG12_big_fil_rev_8_21_14_0_65_36_11]PIZ90459.1 MAG: 30S ribosomal protein S10 [bacterium (Candidatus Moisslbacteria) CG_4_10_14_0_2_um_filter_36_61]PJC0088